jgi:hypothetical protein
MADLPILFSGAMVRAILREIEQPGTGKTQTRRVLTPQPTYHGLDDVPSLPTKRRYTFAEYLMVNSPNIDACTPYEVGDRLYVREAWRCEARLDKRAPRDIATNYPGIKYIATAEPDDFGIEGKFRQAMHMPRWASRITLIVTEVRVQRLQEINEADAIAEGIEKDHAVGMTNVWGWRDYLRGHEIAKRHYADPRDSFHSLWDSLNSDRGYSWEANPWVAAYTFRPIAGNIDQIAEAA